MPVRSQSACQWRSTAGGSYALPPALAGRALGASAIGAVRAGGLDQLPDPLGSGWDIDVLDAELTQRVTDRIGNRRYRANGASLADALHAERVRKCRRHRAVVFHHRQPVGAHRRVVSQRTADQLAGLLVVDDLLIQRLRRALSDAALHLAIDQQRVDHVAAVIDADVLDQSDFASV